MQSTKEHYQISLLELNGKGYKFPNANLSI